MLDFTVLSENRDGKICKGEEGLSIYIKVNENEFLLDTGISDLYTINAKKLNIDLEKISTVILSHGHSDHTNGVVYLNPGKTIIMHPKGFKGRYSIRKKEFVGFPIPYEVLKKLHNVILTRDSMEVFENVWFLGEIPMNIDFEADGNYSTTLDTAFTQTDYTEDDSGIVIKTEYGLFVMTGCGHRGICNTIEKARQITNEPKVYAVLSGFHFRSIGNQKGKIDKSIDYFKKVGVEHLFLGHCVSDQVIEYMESEINFAEIHRLYAGVHFSI